MAERILQVLYVSLANADLCVSIDPVRVEGFAEGLLCLVASRRHEISSRHECLPFLPLSQKAMRW